MSILSGFFKTKKYRKTDTGYQLQSEWTSASTVEMADGNTAETNLGAIQGITDSLTATSSNVALSAKAGNNLQGQIDEVNSNLKKVGTDEFTEYTFDTTKYKLLVITFFETSIVNSYVTVIIPSIIGIQQASIVICVPVENVNYVYNVVVKFQVKTDGIGFAFAQFGSCSSSTLNRNLVISEIHNIVGIK